MYVRPHARRRRTLRLVETMARGALLLSLLAGCTELVSPDAAVSDAYVSDAATIDAPAPVDAASPLALTDLRVVPNDTNVLSCFVEWTTDRPSSSVVDFGDGTTLTARVREDALVTAHRVLVIGMHAQSSYRLVARSIDAMGTAQSETTFTTLALPDGTPDVRLDVPASAPDAWTLFGAQVLGEHRTTALMVDRSGRIVWYRVHPDARDPGPVTLVGDGRHVLIGTGGAGICAIEVDLAGVETWRGPVSPTERGDGQIHHEYRRLPNGHYAILRYEVQSMVLGDVLEEMAPDGSSVWQWNVFDWLTPGSIDWTHGNALDLASMPGRALYSAPALNTIFAIDRTTGEIAWRLGEGGSFAADPSASDPWFRFQHDPVVLPNGHLLVYDNGSPSARPVSRVLEYALDETTMQARIVWTYPPEGGGDVWFSQALGSVERLANGNTAITAGSIDAADASRIFEVTPAGERVFQFSVLPIGVAPTRVFRSQQIAALVEPIL